MRASQRAQTAAEHILAAFPTGSSSALFLAADNVAGQTLLRLVSRGNGKGETRERRREGTGT